MQHQDKDDSLQSRVSEQIYKLQSQYLAGVPSARGSLAELRKAVDEEPGINPRVWFMTMEAVPERWAGTSDAPTYSELAAFTALTLYAVHQRGKNAPMHVPGMPFAKATGELVRQRTASMKRRFDAVLTATTFDAQRYHLRSLVGLLSSDGIGFDYGRFANDLVHLQRTDSRPGIQREWGRQFYQSYAFTPKNESK